jgi:hypothetical protein
MAAGLALFMGHSGGELELPTVLLPLVVLSVGLVAVLLKAVTGHGDGRRVLLAVALALLVLGALAGLFVLRSSGVPLG